MNAAQRFFVRRLVVAFLGLLVVMAGTALMAFSELGVSAATAPMYTMSLVSGGTFGLWVGIINSLYFVAQLLLLRRNFPPEGWLQLGAVLIAGVSLDIWMFVLGWIQPETYWQQCIVMLLGIFFIGAGMAFMVPARTFFMPFEGLVQTIADLTRSTFPRWKVGFDIAAVVFSLTVTLIMLDGVATVREATVLSALLVGPIVGWLLPLGRRAVGVPMED